MATKKSTVNSPASGKPEIRKAVYGWLPDIPDNRDHMYGAVRKIPAKLPAKTDLRPGCSTVEDQKDLGSCTANALAGALEYLMKKDKAAFADMSRLFIYYNERVIEHSVKTDSGAMIRDGIKTLAKQEACIEKSWPYDIVKFATKPPKTCYTEALNYQISPMPVSTHSTRCVPAWPTGFPLSLAFRFTTASNPKKWQRPEWSICPRPEKR